MKNKYARRSKISEGKVRELVRCFRYFAADLTALQAAALALAGCVTTVEKSYEAAQVYGPPVGEKRGVVLYLHGCGGSLESHKWDFAQLLMNAGLVVVAPDSFADPRPPKSCGPPWMAKSQIYSVRDRQAKHALEQIRMEYPGKPIVVWGHSEGGGVANLIDEKVAGIVTTGYHCGYRNRGTTQIREDVPFLAIMGTKDSYMPAGLAPTCARVFQSPAWEYVIVDGMGHQPVVRRREVQEAVASFLERLGF